MFKDLRAGAWKIPFHPLIWGVYSVLALYLFNIRQVPFYAITQSVTFAIALTSILFLFSYSTLIIVKSISSWKIAVQIAIVTLLLSALYFGIYNLLAGSALQEIVRHRFLFPLWIVIFIALIIVILQPIFILQNLKNLSVLERSSAIASLILVLFFSYGHVSGLLTEGMGFKKVMETHGRLLLLWTAVLVGGIVFILKVKNITAITRGANVTAAVLLILIVAQIAFFEISNSPEPVSQVPVISGSSSSLSNDRDVYYIILDAYSREDLLRDTLDFDNSSFIQELESIGFVIPECTQTNYHATILSLTSALNMNYLDELLPDLQSLPKYYDYTPYLKHSLVRKIFEESGYETYTFKGLFPFANISDSTYFYDLFADENRNSQIETQNFQYIFLQTTAIRTAADYFERNTQATESLPPLLQSLFPLKNVFSNHFYKQYQQSSYHLDLLEQIPEMPGKKFVYAHLFVTHEPYVFTADGNFRWPPIGDADGYRDQILFINKRMIQIVKTIIEKSSKPPIIILQGDHGWVWDERRNRNLNAYYLPDGGNALIYPEISPVNTFRVVMNHYFGGKYELLPDVSYYANFEDEDMSNLKLIPGTCVGK
jgi:hypothetical protein